MQAKAPTVHPRVFGVPSPALKLEIMCQKEGTGEVEREPEVQEDILSKRNQEIMSHLLADGARTDHQERRISRK